MEKAELDVTSALEQGLLSLKTRLKIAGDVANGLKAIHEAHYIHQDIKADSILVSCQDKCTVSHKMNRIRESDRISLFKSLKKGRIFRGFLYRVDYIHNGHEWFSENSDHLGF